MFLDEFFLYLYLSHQKSNRLRRNLSIVYNVKLNWTETNGVLRKISRTRKSPAAGMLMAACIAVPRVEVNNTKGL